MKPKDVKCPFRFETRRPFLQEKLFFVPSYYQEHHLFSLPPFSDERLFGNDHPIHLEYCSGNGSWIIDRALAAPRINWVAVEKDFERVRKIVSKMTNHHLKNLFVVSGEAETFTKHYLKDESLCQIYVNFPDPWPKLRHAKHRVFQIPFVKDMARVLKTNGHLMAVTDDPPYSEQMRSVLIASGDFEPIHPYPYYVTEWEGYGSSFFERLWREKGKEIRYIEMKKKAFSKESL